LRSDSPIEEYDAKAAELARLFADNFAAFADLAGADVVAAGPAIA
jgi:ATP-dependent phosphoenolpyruvate carboxykinase